MADDNDPACIEIDERFIQQLCLRVGAPDSPAGPLAEAETRPVEGDHPMILGEQIEEATQHEVTGDCSVAVEQDDNGSGSALDVMKTHSVDGEEFALRRMPPFRPARQREIDQ